MPKIRITNPQPRCAKYTTASQAERFVRRGQAVLFGNELTFLSSVEKRQLNAAEQQLRAERCASDVYIRGMVWWNGDAGVDIMKRPGEVRS